MYPVDRAHLPITRVIGSDWGCWKVVSTLRGRPLCWLGAQLEIQGPRSVFFCLLVRRYSEEAKLPAVENTEEGVSSLGVWSFYFEGPSFSACDLFPQP